MYVTTGFTFTVGFTLPGKKKWVCGIDLLQIQKYTTFILYFTLKKEKQNKTKNPNILIASYQILTY